MALSARRAASGGRSMREGEPGWLASLLGAAVLIAGGFALGLVAGVVSDEPELVVGHLVGRSEEVVWLPEGEAEFTATNEVVSPARVEPPPEVLDLDEVLVLESAATELEPLMAPPAADPPEPLPAVAAPPPARRASRDVDSLPQAGSAAPTGFAVQVGAFSEGGSARDVRQKLLSKGFDSYVIPASVSGDGKWRVRVGPVPTKVAAEVLASRLKSEERLPTWVLAEGGG